jgi:hypothetical protein
VDCSGNLPIIRSFDHSIIRLFPRRIKAAGHSLVPARTPVSLGTLPPEPGKKFSVFFSLQMKRCPKILEGKKLAADSSADCG